MTPDVNTRLIDFKDCKGKEFVVENEDGSYTIAINSRLSYTGQLEAYKHAMEHINGNDFSKNNVQKIEYDAHKFQAKNDVAKSSKNKTSSDQEKWRNDHIKRLRASREKNRIKMQEDMERVQFLQDYCDVFALESHHHRYGSDL